MPPRKDLRLVAHLRGLLTDWKRQHPQEPESEFARLAGLTKSQVSALNSGQGGAGPAMVEGFARVFNKTATQIRAEAHGEAYGAKRLRFSDLPDWQKAVTEARQTLRGRRIAEAAWVAAAGTTNDVTIPRSIDAAAALALAEFWEAMLAAPDTTPKAS